MRKMLFAALAFGALAFTAPAANATPLAGAAGVTADDGLVVEARHWWRRHGGAYHHPPRHSRYWDHQRTWRRGHLHRGWGPNHPRW